MPPALIALGATLVLNGPDGERRLPLESFFLGYKNTDLRPGEFIHSVRLPLPAADTRLFIYKVSKRLDDDISAVLGAFHLTVSDGRVSDCRLAYGGMAATPPGPARRSRRCEAKRGRKPRWRPRWPPWTRISRHSATYGPPPNTGAGWPVTCSGGRWPRPGRTSATNP